MERRRVVGYRGWVQTLRGLVDREFELDEKKTVKSLEKFLERSFYLVVPRPRDLTLCWDYVGW